MHGIVYDEIHDEFAVTNPFAEAILFFRGSANGEEPPLRVIQGPSTYLYDPDTLAIDPVHDEVFVPSRDAVLVFRRDANGDVAPKRILRGINPKRVAVDPKNNLLVVANSRNPRGLLIFNRTAEGFAKPRAVIAGPMTGITNPQALQVDPVRQHIIVGVTDTGRGAEQKPGFIGVWNYTDRGDVPPKAVIKGPACGMIRPRGVALNAEKKEIYVVDMRRNALFTFSWPEIF